MEEHNMKKTNKISGLIAAVSFISAIIMPKIAPIFLMILVVSMAVWVLTECGLDNTNNK